MTLLSTLFVVLVFVLLGVVLLRVLAGDINTRGLTYGRDGVVVPDRVQALITAVSVPLLYLYTAVIFLRENPMPDELPEVPDWLLVLATASQTIFLAGKISRQATRTDLTTRNEQATTSDQTTGNDKGALS